PVLVVIDTHQVLPSFPTRRSSDLPGAGGRGDASHEHRRRRPAQVAREAMHREAMAQALGREALVEDGELHRVEGRVAQAGKDGGDRKSTRLNSSHVKISYAVFCLK